MKRVLLDSHYLNDKFFKNYGLVQDFMMELLKNFICKIPKEIFPTLVILFYGNLNYVYVVLISEVMKHHIRSTLEEFILICNLPYTNSDYDDSEEGNKFKTIEAYISFLENPKSCIPSSFTIGLICQNLHLIHYVVKHVFLPIKSNSIHINKSNIAPLWFFDNRIGNNLASAMIHHMVGSKKKNTVLPYSGLVTKIME